MSLADEILRLFPKPTFRPYQEKTIKRMADHFETGGKVVLLEAPTGFGKSAVNTAFARYYNSFYATPQLALIDQIKADKDLAKYYAVIKGRENYKCYYEDVPVDLGPCARIKDFKCERFKLCPYWIAKLKALRSKAVLTSFAYILLEGMAGEGFPFLGRRDLLILDESHSIDRHIIEHVSVEVSPYSLPVKLYEKYRKEIERISKDGAKRTEVFEMLDEIYMKTSEYYDQLTLFGELTISNARDKKKIERWRENYNRFLSSGIEDWVWSVQWRWYKRERIPVLVIQPIKGSEIAQHILWWRAPRVIISSATILDPNRFCDESGILRVFKPDEILYLRVPSTFPPENRPVVDVSEGRMSMEARGEYFPRAVEIVREIIEKHRYENILIHAHSYELAEALARELSKHYGGKILTHTSENRTDALFEFKKGVGKVFISVAFTEGIDLPYDQCRVQVLFKTPYPDIKDRRVAVRLNRGEYNWYYLETVKQAIQAYGRAVRAPDDRAVFYVVDGSFRWLCKRTWRWLPGWFKEVLPPTCRPKYEGGV